MTRTYKIIAAIVVALMLVAVLPVAAFAEEAALKIDEKQTDAYWKMVWAPLDKVEADMLAKGATPAECTMAVYKAALESPYIDAGSIADLDDNGFSFTTKGMHGGYDYKLRNIPYVSNITEEMVEEIVEVAKVRAEAAETRTASSNGPTSKNVLLVGPWYSQDSSFTDQYKNEAQQLANDLGGTYTALTNSNAYGTAIASGHLNKGIVIYDSHGASYSSTSYMQIATSTSLTSSDYSNGWAYNGSSWWGIDGRYVKNHCGGTLSNCMVWMAMCEGMKKSGGGVTGTALLEAGAGVVYGYSQSVSFYGDYDYEAYFWNRMREGDTVAEAIAKMKSQYGNYDTYSSPSAYPVVMSPQDAYPSNPDSVQTVYSNWVMFPTASYTVTATSNNTSYGTVSVNGTTITASPKTGYYVESCTLVSGTATWTINGNTIEVNPTSNCTIRVNFAAKTQNTVTFIASGTNVGTQTAYTGDSITLPTTVSVNPDGWTFIGWVTAQVAETTNKPTYYAPGASYTVNGNATLYALYNRTEGGGGEVVYQLTDHLEDGLNYIIVAQDTISGTSAKAVGNTVVTSNKYLSPVSVTLNNTDNTVTATAANLPKVVWEASGNATSGYSFYNAAVGKYMALNSAQTLYPATSGIIYWLYESDQSLNNQVDTDGYYWLSYSDGSDSVGYERYTTSTSSDNAINLYVETQLGTTYYTTDPVASTPTYTVTFKDWDGTVLSTQQVVEGGAATAPANPSRVGYTFTGWDKTFNNITADTVVTAQYTINSYRLTIYYKYADGTTAASTYTQNYNYGAAYSVTSPVIEGYTASQAVVSGTMGTSAVTVTVTYTANEPDPTILLGDVNCDGIVDFADVSALYMFLLGTDELTAQGMINADVNGDGNVDFGDVGILYGMLIG